jgi:DNA-binding transcriptional regulator LsrR (DeoR family)
MFSANGQRPASRRAHRWEDHDVTRSTLDDDAELLVTAAVMYYEQNASQKEIASHLGVSRPTVSRLLSRAREQGIVRIEIVPPHVDPALPARLRRRLGLRGVYVAPGRADEADPGPLLAASLGEALDEAHLAGGDVVLVSWGRAVHSVSRHVHRSHPGVVVAPAMGGNASDRPWFQPNEIVRTWALALGGQPRYLHAPALVSPALEDSLRSEADIRETIELWDRAKVALVGVGAWPKPDASYAAAGFPVDDPALADAAGDVGGWSFTIEGALVPYRDERVIFGVTPEQFRRIPHVICFAGGPSKARAAIGAARAGLVNVLVTDAATARAIDAYLDEEAANPAHAGAGAESAQEVALG